MTKKYFSHHPLSIVSLLINFYEDPAKTVGRVIKCATPSIDRCINEFTMLMYGAHTKKGSFANNFFIYEPIWVKFSVNVWNDSPHVPKPSELRVYYCGPESKRPCGFLNQFANKISKNNQSGQKTFWPIADKLSTCI